MSIDPNISESKNVTFDINNTFTPGRLTKQASDKLMFNAQQFHSIMVEAGNPENSEMIVYDDSVNKWIYTGHLGPTGNLNSFTGSTGADTDILLITGTVATDTVNTNASYTTVNSAINNLGTLCNTYLIKIIGNATDTSITPPRESLADYTIKINKGATWYLNLNSEISISNNLTIFGPGTLSINITASDIENIFNLSLGNTLTFQNLNIIILESGITPDTFRTILSNNSNLIIKNCNITIINDEIKFRYTTLSVFGNTDIIESRFSFTGTNNTHFIYGTNANNYRINITNSEFIGESILYGVSCTGPSSNINLYSISTYFDSGSNYPLIGSNNRFFLNSYRDFGTKGSYIYTDGLTGCKITNTNSQYYIKNSSPFSCVNNCYSNYLFEYGDDINVNNLISNTIYCRSNNTKHINIYSPIIDITSNKNYNKFYNVISNDFNIRGNNHIFTNNISQSTLDILTFSNDIFFSNTSFTSNFGGSYQTFPNLKINTSKIYNASIFVTESASVLNCFFAYMMIIVGDSCYIGCNRFEGGALYDEISPTGPLFIGNLGIPFNGPQSSMPGSTSNSYLL